MFSYSLLPFVQPLSHPHVAYAQDEDEDEDLVGLWYSPNWKQFGLKTFDTDPTDLFGERYTFAQVNWIIWSLIYFPFAQIAKPGFIICALRGESGCFTTLGETSYNPEIINSDLATKQKPDQNLVQAVFEERSFSGITYFKDKLRRFHLVPEAQAQEGFGFTGALSPIQNMWRASRNITYSLFALVILVMAFMIMFRVKIAPQVAITAQSALPRLTITIILVTFSYAIAGLLIDLMYVVIGLISVFGGEFAPPGVADSPIGIFNFLTKGQPFNFDVNLGFIGLSIWYIVGFTIATLFIMTVLIALSGSFVLGMLTGLPGPITTIPAITGAAATASFIAFLAFAVLVIISIFHVIRVSWMLLKTYAIVLLLTIFAPFQILLGAIFSGGSLGFGAWLRTYLSNLAIFVVVGLIFLLSWIFLGQACVLALNAAIPDSFPELAATIAKLFFGPAADPFTSPFLEEGTASWPPLMGIAGEEGAALLMLGASFVLFTIIPRTANLIKALIQGQPFSYGSAVGEALGPFTLGAGFGGAAGVGYIGGELKKPGHWAGGSAERQALVDNAVSAAQKWFLSLGRK
jgi:hypothetical protein